MSGELDASAWRFETARKAMIGRSCCPWECEPYASTGGRLSYLVDTELMASAYLARLAADRAEREERARPIDAGWLESLGFAPDGVLDLGGDGRLTWRASHGDVTLWGYPGTACSTRGRLLDLLIALKGGAE